MAWFIRAMLPPTMEYHPKSLIQKNLPKSYILFFHIPVSCFCYQPNKWTSAHFRLMNITSINCSSIIHDVDSAQVRQAEGEQSHGWIKGGKFCWNHKSCKFLYTIPSPSPLPTILARIMPSYSMGLSLLEALACSCWYNLKSALGVSPGVFALTAGDTCAFSFRYFYNMSPSGQFCLASSRFLIDLLAPLVSYASKHVLQITVCVCEHYINGADTLLFGYLVSCLLTFRWEGCSGQTKLKKHLKIDQQGWIALHSNTDPTHLWWKNQKIN